MSEPEDQTAERPDRMEQASPSGRIRLGWSRTRFVAVFLILAMVLFVALNVISNNMFRAARLDATENNVATLSKGTISTLKKLKEPIYLQFFFSAHLASEAPQLRTYARRVEDLLRTYAARSGGKLVLEVIDPKPFSEEEDQAVSGGLEGAQTRSGAKFYFGLTGVNSVGKREQIPFFILERRKYLEYDLTKLVHDLNTLKQPVLGIVTNLPLDTGAGGLGLAMRGQSKSFLIYDQLSKNYATRFLEQDFDRIPEDVDVLLIAHPKKLSDSALYAIDQFVLKGGRALVFVDPYSEVSAAPGPMGMPLRGGTASSDLGPLLDHWGVTYDREVIVGDRGAAAPVALSGAGGAPSASYVLWLSLKDERFSAKDPVTAQLQLINLATPGYLEPKKDSPLKFEPLITSTKDAKTFSRFDAAANRSPQELLRNFAPEDREFIIAARLSGKLKSAFPKGPPEAAKAKPDPAAEAERKAKAKELGVSVKKEEKLPEHVAESKEPAHIIVVADSDIFDDRFWVMERNVLGQRVAIPTADNEAFITNAVDNLMGSGDLISLRTRASEDRPFVVVEKLRKKAEQRFLAQEKLLRSRLEETEKRLRALRGQSPGADGMPGQETPGAELTADERKEIARFTQQYVHIRNDLRKVQRSLVADIETLGAWLGFINIALVPLLVAGTAVGLAVMRRRRRAGKG